MGPTQPNNATPGGLTDTPTPSNPTNTNHQNTLATLYNLVNDLKVKVQSVDLEDDVRDRVDSRLETIEEYGKSIGRELDKALHPTTIKDPQKGDQNEELK